MGGVQSCGQGLIMLNNKTKIVPFNFFLSKNKLINTYISSDFWRKKGITFTDFLRFFPKFESAFSDFYFSSVFLEVYTF